MLETSQERVEIVQQIRNKILMITAMLAVMVAMTGIVAAASNLVTNGGFENPVVSGSWDTYSSISGWTELNSQLMELQINYYTPYEGNQYLELDAYAPTTVYQDITTKIGKDYILSFAFSPRPGVADNRLQISWNGTIVDTLSESGASNTHWTIHTYYLTATSATTRLQFKSLDDPSSSCGTFLDDITLASTGISPSPPPELPTNLVTNGGFEYPQLNHGTWSLVDTLPGWTKTTGPQFELQNNIFGWTPYEGDQYLELDSTGPTELYQDITTVPESVYNLSFAFSPRPGVADNRLQISWNGTIVDTLSESGASNTHWTIHTYDLTATSATTRLQFKSLDDPSSSCGTFLDDVTLASTGSPIYPTPELSTIVLVGVGMFGLIFITNRKW